MVHSRRLLWQGRVYVVSSLFALFLYEILSLCYHVGNIAGMAFPLFTQQMYAQLTYKWANTLFALIATLMIPIPFVGFIFPSWRFTFLCDISLRSYSLRAPQSGPRANSLPRSWKRKCKDVKLPRCLLLRHYSPHSLSAVERSLAPGGITKSYNIEAPSYIPTILRPSNHPP